jgi:hypothetical protein
MDLPAEGQQCWRHLLCVVGFQNSKRNKGKKRRRNNGTLTGLCVAIRERRGGGSPLLPLSKPSLTYPSIIEKQGDSIHHSFLMLWPVSPWFERHAKDWNRATGLFCVETDFLCCYCYSFFNSCPFALCMDPVNFFVDLSHRLFLTDCTLIWCLKENNYRRRHLNTEGFPPSTRHALK